MTTTPEMLERLRGLGTSSLVDAGGELRVLPLDLRPVGPSNRLVGRAVTADAGADLMSVLAALQECAAGDVLVVAAGGDERAVAGELFASEALRRGVTGLVVDGRVRDVGVLAELDLPVFARGVAPHAYPARRVPRVQVPVTLGDVEVRPGDLLVGDADGLLVGSAEAFLAVLDDAERIEAREGRLRDAVSSGRSLFEALNVDEHVAALREGRDSRLSFRELSADGDGANP